MDIADIVISKNGRDEGKQFIVVVIEDGYALLADGRCRRVEKPKHKKMKHCELVKPGVSKTAEKLRNNERVTNNEIRRGLAEDFCGDSGEGGM